MEWFAEVDQFQAHSGRTVVTIVVRQKLSADESGSMRLIHGAPFYSTEGGEAVEKIDGRRFRVVATGEILQRL
jgi:hypothetical protein